MSHRRVQYVFTIKVKQGDTVGLEPWTGSGSGASGERVSLGSIDTVGAIFYDEHLEKHMQLLYVNQFDQTCFCSGLSGGVYRFPPSRRVIVPFDGPKVALVNRTLIRHFMDRVNGGYRILEDFR